MAIISTDFFPSVASRNQGISSATQDFLSSLVHGFDRIDSLLTTWHGEKLRQELADAKPGDFTEEQVTRAQELIAGVYFDTDKNALMVRSFIEGIGLQFTTEIDVQETELSVRTYFKKGDLDAYLGFFGAGQQVEDSPTIASVKLDGKTGKAVLSGFYNPNSPAFLDEGYSPEYSTVATIQNAELIIKEVGDVIDGIKRGRVSPTIRPQSLPENRRA